MAATETLKSAISDERFSQCAKSLRARAYKVLSFCYRISKMHDEAGKAIDELERLGIVRGQSHLNRHSMCWNQRCSEGTVLCQRKLAWTTLIT
jgi:hypothetical protein